MRSPSRDSSSCSSQPVSDDGALAQRRQACGRELGERGLQRHHPEQRVIAHLPAGGAPVGPELRRHLEAGFEVVAPPAGKPRRRRVEMPLMHEGAGRRAGTSVQVLVRAPGREVRVPVVQRERQVADRVGEVESGDRADAMRGFRERPDVEPLTGQVLDARQQDEREPRALAFDLGDEVLLAQELLARARRDLDAGRRGIAPVPAESATRRHSGRKETRLARSGSRGVRASVGKSSPSGGAG